MAHHRDVQVKQLRVSGAPGDTTTIRLRLGRMLHSAEIVPAALPPAAILLVRHLVDPLPGQLNVTRLQLRPNSAWEAAARRTLAEQTHRATRPQRGVIAGSPDAILFTDEAEMLAALALAVRRGISGSGWWWPAVRKQFGAAPLPVLLQQHVRLLPATLHYLDGWGEAEGVVAALTPGEAVATIQTLARVHALAGVLPLPWLPSGRDEDDHAAPRPLPDAPADIALLSSFKGNVSPESASPPWAAWLPVRAALLALGRERVCLLAIGLSLQRQPVAVRSAAFGHALRDWWQAMDSPKNNRSGASSPGTLPPSVPASLEPPHPAGHPAPSAARAQAGKKKERDVPDAASTAGGTAASTPKHTGPPAPLSNGAPKGVDERTVASLHRRTASTENQTPEAAMLETGADAAVEGRVGLLPGIPATTSLGGIFYLINFMRALDLPGCFEAGWELASQVGPWAVLELLGRALVGAEGVRYKDDPLWRVLAELDARSPDSPPGASYRLPGSPPSELPAGWETVTFLWQPDDSPLLDVVQGDLRRWVGVAVPPVQQRLIRALGVEDGASLPAALLLYPAQLYLTRSHVDLVFRLEDASLPIRRVGLDANPGWLPTFGRVVTFHFR